MRDDVWRVGRNGRRKRRSNTLGDGRIGGLAQVRFRISQHERLAQHLVHVFDELDLNRLEDHRWDVPDVLLVLDRDQHLLDATAMRGADPCITSPSRPVIMSLPFPGITWTSVARSSPPMSVQASPVETPIRCSTSALPNR